MSYLAHDLRSGILDLFDEAAAMSAFKVARGELLRHVGPRARPAASPRKHTRLSNEERKVRRRLTENKMRARVREIRDAERAARSKEAAPIFWVGPPPDPILWNTHRLYGCTQCGARATTHRCPIERGT